jgi:hypothetical protein
VLPHQDAASAEAATERILERLAKGGPAGVGWHSRLLCYPGDAAEISNLLTVGWTDRRTADGRSNVELTA